LIYAAMEGQLGRVLGSYNLGELRTVRRIKRGFVNDNWAVETAWGCYFLKHRHPHLRRPDLIRAQHDLMGWLRQAGFPAPAVVPTASGETFLMLDGEFYEIHEYIEGKHYDHNRPAHLEEAALMLGRYHTHVQGCVPQALCNLDALYSPLVLSTILVHLRAAWQLDQNPDLTQTAQELEVQAADLAARLARRGALPHLVIHGDYYGGNLLFDGDRIVGVVDYDKARWQPRVVELAEALIYFTTERLRHLRHIVYSGTLDLGAVHQFLVAYTDAVSLSESEIQALPHWIRTIWLCASLNPPLEPLMSLEAAPQAVPEVLALADWAQTHASDIVEIGLAAQKDSCS
jgi:homoserine kinase type II